MTPPKRFFCYCGFDRMTSPVEFFVIADLIRNLIEDQHLILQEIPGQARYDSFKYIGDTGSSPAWHHWKGSFVIADLIRNLIENQHLIPQEIPGQARYDSFKYIRDTGSSPAWHHRKGSSVRNLIEDLYLIPQEIPGQARHVASKSGIITTPVWHSTSRKAWLDI